jgi:hypothetical protein
MNLKLIAIGIVAMIIIAGAFFLYMPSDDDSENTSMTATIVIEELDTGEMIEAEIDLSEPDWTEQMMLSFGENIRSTDFKPLYSTDPGGGDNPGLINGPIRANGKYAVYLKGTCHVSGAELSSNNVDLTLTFHGKVMKPTAGDMSSTAATSGQNVKIIKNIPVNTDYVFDQSTAGKFTYVGTASFLGANLDGAWLYIDMGVIGQDGTKTVSYTGTFGILLSVGDWTDASVSASITDISVGTTVI